ncbi:sensor domain-containing diguanylate cyclase [Aeromonas jandaei]|uniref:sensor domain-containing diguanylate cyclase n=1 Tax=Aeromonas jandaei TaxID=650 RepID=UPI000F53E8E3|nr:sensor domain-containing diguanylate cyclase [Aeromonas jandaei]RQM75355.1 sensor domain-containing diguanylate cyclase [Aeromonas jandaei]
MQPLHETPDPDFLRLDALRRLQALDSPTEERFIRITRMARNIFDVPIALISFEDNEHGWAKPCYGLNMHESIPNISFCRNEFLKKSMLVIEDATQDPLYAENPLAIGEPYIRFYAGHSLVITNGLHIGSLCIIDRKPRVFGDKERALFTDLASTVESELRAVQMATIDELTGITNRRGFILLAERYLQHAFRTKRSLSLLFIDLNNFKSINDRFGHDVGDDALCQAARLINMIFRSSDVCARLGGDEYVVLLPEESSEYFKYMRSRIVSAFEEFNVHSGKPYTLSCSIGMVSYDPATPPDLNMLLRLADEEMYRCKHSL